MISIRINIANRYYPLKIVETDEQRLREAALRINSKIEEFKARYKGQDLQDALAMATLQFVMSLSKLEEEINDNTMGNRLLVIDHLLEDHLLKQ